MASYNPNNVGNMNGGSQNKGLFNRLLRKLTNYGMDYDDMIAKNTVGINISEDPLAIRSGGSVYDMMSSRTIAKILNIKSFPYLDKNKIDKRRILREYAIKDYIARYIDIVTSEAIIYNDTHFCKPKALTTNYSNDIRDKYQEFFEKIYNIYKFSDGRTAGNMMQDFLIDGYISMEIVWDSKKQNIISFNKLDPSTILVGYEESIGIIYLQNPDDPITRRIFLDSQIIHISYSTQNDFARISYVEGLIKPYNMLKLIEQTKIIFNVNSCALYKKYTIPTKGLSKQQAKLEFGQMIADNAEHVDWDDNMGILSINGTKQLNFGKDFWRPEGDAGSPDLELISPTGTDLNEEVTLKYFSNAFKEESRIPSTWLNHDGGGGPSFVIDSQEVNNEEKNFANFIGKLRVIFKELILKPLKMQMCMEFPELLSDEIFLNQVNIVFSVNESVESFKKLKSLSKRIEIATNLATFKKADDTIYFHPDYIVKYILELSDDEIKENESMWIKSKTEAAAAASPQGGAPPDGGGMPDMGGGGGGSPMPDAGAEPTPQGGEQGGSPPQGSPQGAPQGGSQAQTPPPSPQGGAQSSGGTPDFTF